MWPGFGEINGRCVENREKNKGTDGNRDPMGHVGACSRVAMIK